jgi:hypothetical protein
MRPGYWLLTTVSTVLLATATIAGLNAAVDIYGLYRPARGRHLPVLGDARVAKYLLSMRYVPESFNAILSGASVSANWDVTGIRSLRVYNESLNGGNIIEEKSLIQAALERPGIRVVFLLVDPSLTFSHEFRTVELKPSLKFSALGSLSLWSAYKDMANIWLRRIPQEFDYAGTETFFEQRSEMNIYMKQMWNAQDFTLDPLALQARQDLIAALRAHGVKLVFVVPPTSEQLLQTKRAQMERYLRRMRAEIGPGGLWIDFLSQEYTDLCAKGANFSDGVHLTADGARQVVAYMDTAVNRWIAEGRLAVAKR